MSISDDEAKRRGLHLIVCAMCRREFWGTHPQPLFNCYRCVGPPPETYYDRHILFGEPMPGDIPER